MTHDLLGLTDGFAPKFVKQYANLREEMARAFAAYPLYWLGEEFEEMVEAFGILHFLQIIYEHKQLLDPILARHDGILIKTEADSLLVIFRRTTSALRCAVEMQRALDERQGGQRL